MNKLFLAIGLIVYMGFPAAADTGPDVSALVHQLQKDDVDERERAAEALGKLGPDAAAAVGPLRKALNDDFPYVRVLAAEALTKIGPAAMPAFIEALKNENAEVRAIGAHALGSFGAKAGVAVPDLVTHLKDPDYTVRQAAARALAQIGPAAASPVMDQLESVRGALRLLDLQVLANIHDADASIVSRLLKQLEDNDLQIRLAATRALVRQGSDHLAELKQGLQSDSATARALVCDALAELGKQASSAVPALTDLLKDPATEVRGSAARALGKMGSDASSALPALKIAAKDSESYVAIRAQEAVTSIGSIFGEDMTQPSKSAQKPMTAAPAPKKPQAPKPAATAKIKKPMPAIKKPTLAKKISPKQKKGLPPPAPLTPQQLFFLAQSTEPVARANAEQAIVQRSSETIPVLIPLLQGGDTTLAEISADLLTKIGTDESKKAVDVYRKHLLDKKTASLLKDLRQEGKTSDDAASELIKIGDPIVKPVAQILTDPHPSSRRAAAALLNKLGKAASPATSSLIDALDDKDPDVRRESAEALSKIGTPEAQKALRFFPIKDKIRRALSYFSH